MNIGDIEDIVFNINCKLYEQFDDECTYLTVTSSGFYVCVEFGNIPIWDSETDDRDEKETLDKHIRRKTMELLTKLKTVAV